MFVGIIATFGAAIMGKLGVSKHYSEGISKWADNPNVNGFLEGLIFDVEGTSKPTPLLSVFDPKQWRSNLVFWGTLATGYLAKTKLLSGIFPNEKTSDTLEIIAVSTTQAPQTKVTKSWSEAVRTMPAQSGEIVR